MTCGGCAKWGVHFWQLLSERLQPASNRPQINQGTSSDSQSRAAGRAPGWRFGRCLYPRGFKRPWMSYWTALKQVGGPHAVVH